MGATIPRHSTDVCPQSLSCARGGRGKSRNTQTNDNSVASVTRSSEVMRGLTRRGSALHLQYLVSAPLRISIPGFWPGPSAVHRWSLRRDPCASSRYRTCAP